MFASMAYAQQATDDQAINNVGGNANAADNKPELTPEEKAAAEKAAEEARAKLHGTIKANFNNQVDVVETNFHFRKVKDEATKIETKRPTVTIPVPAPSVEGIVAILETGGKGLELLLEAVRDKIVEQARELINDNEALTADNFPYEKLSWENIANLPKAERRGGGISKETWEEFAEDYKAVMPGVTGKTKESVELAAKVFVSKFANAKTNKPVLKKLEEQLGIYASATTRGEEMTTVIEWLSNKLDTLIKTDETNLLNAL